MLDLDNLSGLSTLRLAFCCFFSLLTQGILVVRHERVEDHPLGRLLREDGCLGRVSLDSTLAQHDKRRLRGTLLVVEHVTKGFLLLLNTVVRKLATSRLN